MTHATSQNPINTSKQTGKTDGPNEAKCTKDFLLGCLIEVMEKGKGAVVVRAAALAARMLGYCGPGKTDEPKPTMAEDLTERLKDSVKKLN